MVKKLTNKFTMIFASAMLVMSLAGCSNLSSRDKNTIIDASIGVAAGSVLTGGSGIGTAGGAAIGGIISKEVGRHKK